MNLIFEDRAKLDFAYWKKADPKKAKKIGRLIDDIIDSPFSGLGQPEALKHEFSSCWSRRIDREHRLVYYVEGN